MLPLTIEPNTPFANFYRTGKLQPLNDNKAAEMYEFLNEFLASLGLKQYETSNYAKIGEESQHNLNYWRYGSYLGIGPGAHGRVLLDQQLYATRNHRSPDMWLKYWKNQQHKNNQDKILTTIALDSSTQQDENILMGLRLREGLNITNFAKRYGENIWHKIDQKELKL